jgi:hypothetical protein
VPPTLEDAAKSTHTLLTTFTKDGRPKPTRTWATAVGDRSSGVSRAESHHYPRAEQESTLLC